MLRFRIYFLTKANVSTSTGPLSWMNIILFHFVDIEKFVAGKINFRERITVWIMELFWEMKWILRKNKFKHTAFYRLVLQFSKLVSKFIFKVYEGSERWVWYFLKPFYYKKKLFN